jgi:hypothetical protein
MSAAVNDALLSIAGAYAGQHLDQRIAAWRDTLEDLYAAGIRAGRVEAHVDKSALEVITPPMQLSVDGGHTWQTMQPPEAP